MGVIGILGIHEQIARIWETQKRRELTQEEADEMAICLNAHCDWVHKMRKLENLSLLASMTDDTQWLHEICRRIESLSSYNG